MGEILKTEKFVPCVIYGRSSDDETMSKDHNSTEQQLYICKGLVEIVSLKKGAEYRVIEELIENDAISGATKKRPKYQVMISLIRQGRVRAIFAKELSRLSRNMGDFCELISLCKEMNTSIYMRNIEYECGNVFAEMMVKQLAVFSEFERNINIDRTKSSIRSRMKNNAIIHGGPVILGFKKDEEKVGTWIPFQKEIDQVVFIFQLFLELSTYASVCRKLNEMGIKTKTNRKFTKESLKRILTNTKYIGKMRVTKDKGDNSPDVFVDLPFGEIITEEIFRDVQNKIHDIEQNRGRYNRTGKRVYPLTGLLKYEDGSSFTGEVGGKKKLYYYNQKHRKRVDALSIENAVLMSFNYFSDDQKMAAYVRELRKGHNTRLELVSSQIIDVQKEIDSLDGEIDGYLKSLSIMNSKHVGIETIEILGRRISRCKELQDEKKNILEQLVENRELVKLESIEYMPLAKTMEIIFSKLRSADNEVKRGILRNVCREIILLKNNQIRIEWSAKSCGSGGQDLALRDKWGGRWGSNPRQPESQSGALPTELRPPYSQELNL